MLITKARSKKGSDTMLHLYSLTILCSIYTIGLVFFRMDFIFVNWHAY